MFQIALDFARRFDTLKKVCNNRKVFFLWATTASVIVA